MLGVQMAAGHPLHLRDFHGCPDILQTIQKPMYKRQYCHHKSVLSAGKFQFCCFAYLGTKLNVCSLLHHYDVMVTPTAQTLKHN
jgi:hypothetical protein